MVRQPATRTGRLCGCRLGRRRLLLGHPGRRGLRGRRRRDGRGRGRGGRRRCLPGFLGLEEPARAALGLAGARGDHAVEQGIDLVVTEGAEFGKQRRVLRIEVIPAAEDDVVAVVVLLPEVRLADQRPDRHVNDVPGELVDALVEVIAAAQRALVVGVARLVAALALELGHPHAVVVDEPQRSVRADEHVAVLEVAVRDLHGLKVFEQLQPVLLQLLQDGPVRDVLLDVLVQAETLVPLHLDDRVDVTADADALPEIVEGHEVRELHRPDVRGDLGIAVVQVRDVPEEALDRPARAAALDLVDACELAADRPGQSQLVDNS